ncbi:MAG TPA: efflux RND transporter periplasmic adaptor subunit [Nitrospira sp.]|nr:efflux RND transporter periplasmic adaptor subunit [Nitrospira sp.]
MTRHVITLRGISVAIALALTGCSDHGTDSSARPAVSDATSRASETRLIQPPSTVRERVKTATVSLRSVPEIITAPGEVALDPKQVAKITSRIEGQIDRVHVQLGDRVKTGQLLVSIRSLQFDQLIEEYLVGKAQADVAENAFRRTRKLRADDIVPERKLIEDKGRYLETKARFQHIREKLLNMGLSAERLRELERDQHETSHRYSLTSPIPGTIVAQNAVRGQGVAPGNELFEIVDTSHVWVFANLPIEQARKFKEGDMGIIAPKEGDTITAPLTYLAPVADETTRTIRVRFEVANAHHQLKPREYVDVRLTLPHASGAAVPSSSITTVDKARGVFLAADGGFVFMPIETGREGDGWVEIRQGAKAGDEIVTEGVFDLKNVLLKEHIASGD